MYDLESSLQTLEQDNKLVRYWRNAKKILSEWTQADIDHDPRDYYEKVEQVRKGLNAAQRDAKITRGYVKKFRAQQEARQGE